MLMHAFPTPRTGYVLQTVWRFRKARLEWANKLLSQQLGLLPSVVRDQPAIMASPASLKKEATASRPQEDPQTPAV